LVQAALDVREHENQQLQASVTMTSPSVILTTGKDVHAGISFSTPNVFIKHAECKYLS